MAHCRFKVFGADMHIRILIHFSESFSYSPLWQLWGHNIEDFLKKISQRQKIKGGIPSYPPLFHFILTTVLCSWLLELLGVSSIFILAKAVRLKRGRLLAFSHLGHLKELLGELVLEQSF